MSEMSRTLLIATHNGHKTAEFRALLGTEWTVEDLSARPDWPVPVEDGSTFEENARIKALAAGKRAGAGVWVVADDSGLEVDALEGRPGVISARYAGEGAEDGANRVKVMRELEGVPEGKRGARFRCVLAVARGEEILGCFAGAVEGRIAEDATGDGGFGYDPIFVPEGFAESFGVLPSAVKNRLSHRARALGQLKKWLEDGDLTNGP